MTVTPNTHGWDIEITCEGKVIGHPIPCSRWDVLSRLAAVRRAIPLHWHANAYPIIPVRSEKCESGCSDVAA